MVHMPGDLMNGCIQVMIICLTACSCQPNVSVTPRPLPANGQNQGLHPCSATPAHSPLPLCASRLLTQCTAAEWAAQGPASLAPRGRASSTPWTLAAAQRSRARQLCPSGPADTSNMANCSAYPVGFLTPAAGPCQKLAVVCSCMEMMTRAGCRPGPHTPWCAGQCQHTTIESLPCSKVQLKLPRYHQHTGIIIVSTCISRQTRCIHQCLVGSKLQDPAQSFPLYTTFNRLGSC